MNHRRVTVSIAVAVTIGLTAVLSLFGVQRSGQRKPAITMGGIRKLPPATPNPGLTEALAMDSRPG